jgi:hypothetical protein
MRRSKFAAVVLALSSTLFALAAMAAAVVVDDATDTLHNPGCATTGASPCTLRDAITFTNTHGVDIHFAIAGGGVHTIALTSPLPAVAFAVTSITIDGYSQPGSVMNSNPVGTGTNAQLMIELDLTNGGSGGLTIAGNSIVVRGLVINRSIGAGITLTGLNDQVVGCFIGTNPAGTAAGPGNATDGVAIGGNGNKVGLGGSPAVNVISGNGTGIRASGGAQTVAVANNLIGTNAAGTAAIPNTSQGVVFANATGDIGLSGVGGDFGNVISGNLAEGVLVASASSNVFVINNNIGANAAGDAAIGNHGDGIAVTGGHVIIGGHDANEPNFISGNFGHGVFLNGGPNRLEGNRIGLLPNLSPSQNLSSGVAIAPFANDNVIGDAFIANAFNVIFNNGGNGVEVQGAGPTGGLRNSISGNAIFNNGGIGIKLGSGGIPTPNDAGDADTGPNTLLNYPVITSAAVSGGTLTVGGTLNSTPSSSFTVHVYSSSACDASGFGEGHSFLGALSATTDGTGNGTWGGTLPAVPGELEITTTTQDPVFNTSEFSHCFTATGGALPTISIGDVSQAEGNAGTTNFTFSVTISATANATVNFATADGTATAGSDYAANSGTVTFTSGGPLTQTVTVAVNGDTTVEPDETFFVNLSAPVGATILDGQGQGTIINDDVAAVPTITINDVSQNEGNSGTTNFVFTVSLSSTANATVNFATADGTATAGSDYAANSGTVTFTSGGPLTQTITVVVNGDTTVEPNETFFVNLSGASGATIADNQGVGTIINDDSAPTLAVNDASVVEGNTGFSNLVFTVSLSSAPASNVTVNFATADNTALAGSDYVATSGTLTFTPTGPLTQTVTVQVIGDTLVEGTETLFLNLSGATGATIADPQGVGTIFDDDLAVSTADIPTLGAGGIVALILLLALAGGVAQRYMRRR